MAASDRSGENPLLIAALQYAKRGWHVLPCRTRDKAPATKHGFKDATATPGEVVRFWKRNPDANVGIATGTVSRLFVLDVDPRNGGEKSLLELERLHGDLPATVTAQTGGGGRHYYFTLPDGVELGCSILADGLDLKGNGGYVVGPPSLHHSGGQYVWLFPPDKSTTSHPFRNGRWPLQRSLRSGGGGRPMTGNRMREPHPLGASLMNGRSSAHMQRAVSVS